MGLIRKGVTVKQLAANQANAQKAAGPRTELGKRQSSLNAVKHGTFAQVSFASMPELGENPAELQSLWEALYETFRPEDGFERLLVEDMARNRWRRQRLLRAESGIIASNRRDFEIGREWQAASAGRGAGALFEQVAFSEGGLVGAGNFAQAGKVLALLRDRIEDVGFEEDQDVMLEGVYGKTPGLAGGSLVGVHRRLTQQAKAEPPETGQIDREEFLRQLEAEILSLKRLAELDQQRHCEITEAMKDAKMLPGDKDLDRILRYEAALESQFERRLQQLIAWRRARAGTAIVTEENLRADMERPSRWRGRPPGV